MDEILLRMRVKGAQNKKSSSFEELPVKKIFVAIPE